MYSNTRFHQILEALPRTLIEKAAHQHHAERYDKTFKLRDHLITLIYAQFSGARSLRELETAFNSKTQTHYHLGTRAIKRSTLADANRRRAPDAFKFIVEQLMRRVHRQQRKELNEFLYLIDSTPIQLNGRGFEWAEETAVQRTQGLKVHLVIDGNQQTPIYLDVTAPNVNDITPAKNLSLEPNTTYVFDKGYYDYNWWYEIDQHNAFFVTRFKKHAAIRVIEHREINDEAILKDEIVEFKKTGHKNHYRSKPLRRIVVQRDSGKVLTIATNNLIGSASEIAKLYKQRWQIELFFKWIKQNLKVKKFLGRTKNAVLIQLYAAIIGYLLLWSFKKHHRPDATDLYLLFVELKVTLFDRLETEYHRYRRKIRYEQQKYIRENQYALPL